MSIVVQKFDDWIFDNKLFGFQSNSNRFQELTGLTCFWLAKWSIIVWCFAMLLMDILNGSFFRFPDNLFDFFIFAVSVGVVCSLEYKDKNWTHNGLMNESRPNNILERVLFTTVLTFFVLLWITGFVSLLGAVVSVLTIAYFYFSACTPLPPSKSKVQIWYEKQLASLDKCATPAPESLPAKL